MERVLSQEERIKRAEQIAEIRRNLRENNPKEYIYSKRKNSIGEEDKTKNNLILSRMIKQICICLVVYILFFIMKNQNFVFSEEFKRNTKEILSYDINFMEIYNNGINFLQQLYQSEANAEKNTDDENNESKNQVNNRKKDNEKENNNENKEKGNNDKEVSTMEKDVKYLKENYSLEKPVQGIVSSEFGDRKDSNPIVTAEHKGIDIAADKGTKIISAMDGVVDIATTSSSYGKYIEITDGKIKTLYAHCNKLYVKKGEKVKAGQQIAEVGSTGEVTGSHLHFEIKVSERNINPALILNF